MAKLGYLDILQPDEELFFRGLQAGDRYSYSRIRKKTTLLSQEKIKGLTQRSLLPQISVLWSALSDSEKLAWKNAGATCGLTNWRLFVQDCCARMKIGQSGVATPSLLHQSKVGQLHIASPASSIKIVQLHPSSYYVLKKIKGTKSQYQPVFVQEKIALPLQLSINYKSNLTAIGANPVARFFAEIWYRYQALDLSSFLQIDLDLSHDWQNAQIISGELQTTIVGYNLYFELSDVRGDLYFDHIEAKHNGQNWVRDPYCTDIDQEFTHAFYQIPKHWAPVDLPVGAEYGSVYPV